MGATTEIAWTDATFNPWWGCQRVSPGCEHCYAEAFSKRVGLKVWGPQVERRFFGAKHWNEPRKWNERARRTGTRRRVFCASMADVFEGRHDLDSWREQLWALIEETPRLDWLLLTKRPENMRVYAPGRWASGWPENVWAGTTAEDQTYYDKRWPQLAMVPASVRFVSHEPAIGPLKLRPALGDGDSDVWPDWIITGGESGGGARPYDLHWARSLIRQAATVGAAMFVKQLGAFPYEELFDGSYVVYRDTAMRRYWPEYDRFEVKVPPVLVRDPKGGDWTEWPADLRVREFPKAGKS